MKLNQAELIDAIKDNSAEKIRAIGVKSMPLFLLDGFPKRGEPRAQLHALLWEMHGTCGYHVTLGRVQGEIAMEPPGDR